MGYDGNLLYIISREGKQIPFPEDYIFKESYNITPNQKQDVNSKLAANYVLKRRVAKHRRSKIVWNIFPEIDNDELYNLQKLFLDNILNEDEENVRLRYFNPRKNDYEEGMFYSPDITYMIKRTDPVTKKVIYASTRFAAIEY